MDSHQIRLSALGRDVQVGNLYNYYSDVISICKISVPQESISIERNLTRETQWFYLPQLIDLKYEALGIDAHLRISIKKNSVDLNQFWFGNFMKSSQPKEDSNVAKVAFFFRVCRRIESLHPKFLDSKLNEFQLQSGGVATHLVEQVVYGGEFICTLQRTIDRQHETKENAERNLYLAAKDYFNQTFGRNSASPADLPLALDKVKCQILSSLDPGNESEGSFQQSIQHLMDAMSFDKDDSHWRPIEITLRNIPEQMEARLRLETENDVNSTRNMHEVTFNRILNERGALKVAHLEMFPRFQSAVNQFCYLLEPLEQKIRIFHQTLNTITTPERIVVARQISNLLRDLTDWLFHRRSENEKISWLIEGTQLKMLDLAEIEMLTAKNKQNRAKVFVLRAEFYPDPLVQSICTFIDNPTAICSGSPLPVLPILSADKRQLQKIREELHKFSEEALLNISREQENRHSYYIGINSEYQHLADGTITTFGDYKKENDSPMKHQKGTGIKQESKSVLGSEMYPSAGLCQSMEQRDVSKLKHTVPFATPSKSSANINPSPEQRNNAILTSAESSDDTEVVHQSSKSPKVNQANGLSQPDEEGRLLAEENTTSESLVDCIQTHCIRSKLDENENCINKESVDDNGDQSVKYWKSTTSISHREFCHHQTVIDVDCGTEISPPDDTENDKINNQRIAEFFVDERNRYSKLIKKGQPNVYLLNATDTSVGEDLRWFDVGRPARSPPTCGKRNHKVIILMGATGCGKSTLINGMVNYILGVKWNDPFRFKCVREDETTARNQAISQTSSVTAYTIRHHDGMTVPYSITIIDTPGYGDTRGVQRDKEITRNIQQFLTQQKTGVEEIHAACLVAASGQSRLTTTHRYIIDSALSIFGKDIKENIRLLVTFADNADPPVVEACRAANFPVTSASAGIIYSKFNSSVLYSSNVQKQDEDLCFDELFWDMGQENFSKFFSMLEGMNGRNLESTREVIERRSLLEESLKHIEQELEVCLFNIENMEKFQRKMKECGQMMESNKDFVFENKEISYSRVPCESDWYAYNCHKCQKTCDPPIRSTNPTKLRINKGLCPHLACPHHPSEHDYESVEIRRTVKTTKKTLLDLKAKFESSSNEKMTNERLLADCSENLEIAKAKVFSLLDQVGENVRSLESTALRSNTLCPSDYLSLMRSRVAEEQKPGYQIRLETLSELQQSLADNEAAQSQKEWFYPIQTSRPSLQNNRRSGGRWRGRGVLRRSSFSRDFHK